MSKVRQHAASLMGQARTPAKIAASRKNIAKATAKRMESQTPEERSEQAREAALARHAASALGRARSEKKAASSRINARKATEARKAAAALRRAQKAAQTPDPPA